MVWRPSLCPLVFVQFNFGVLVAGNGCVLYLLEVFDECPADPVGLQVILADLVVLWLMPILLKYCCRGWLGPVFKGSPPLVSRILGRNCWEKIEPSAGMLVLALLFLTIATSGYLVRRSIWLLLSAGVVVGEAAVGCCPMVVGVGPTVGAVLEAAIVWAGTEAVVDCSA